MYNSSVHLSLSYQYLRSNIMLSKINIAIFGNLGQKVLKLRENDLLVKGDADKMSVIECRLLDDNKSAWRESGEQLRPIGAASTTEWLLHLRAFEATVLKKSAVTARERPRFDPNPLFCT